jgi:hypothetical protein
MNKPKKQNNIICVHCDKVIKVREGVNVHYTQWQDYYPFQSFFINPYRIDKEKRQIKIYCCRCDCFTVREEVRIKESKGAEQ